MNYNNNNYYEAPYDDQAESEEIEQRIDYKLKEENYPYSEDNIFECMGDDGLVACLPTLATLLQQGDTAAAGLVLSSALYTYWEERSTREVIENL